MRDKGFTLVELLVGMSVSVFLVFVCGVLLLTASNGWKRNDVVLNRQREVSIANKYFANAIREANVNHVTEPADVGDYSDELVVDDKTFYLADNSIYYSAGKTNDGQAIINDNVQSFNVEKKFNDIEGVGGVVVTISYSILDQTQNVEWIFTCRN